MFCCASTKPIQHRGPGLVSFIPRQGPELALQPQPPGLVTPRLAAPHLGAAKGRAHPGFTSHLENTQPAPKNCSWPFCFMAVS